MKSSKIPPKVTQKGNGKARQTGRVVNPSADVAVPWIPLATIVQRVRGLVLGRRGFAVESAVARVSREAGRVTLNMMVRDMDVAIPHAHDTRRLEVVADGLPLFGGTQLDIDTTLVSTLHCDGSARRGAAHRDGVAPNRDGRRSALIPS